MTSTGSHVSRSRFRKEDMRPARLLLALIRRLVDIPSAVAWHQSPLADRNRATLRLFHNLHTSQRCFLIANGPSLAQMDLSPLKNEITLGMNRIYLHFPVMGFEPTYYVATNELVISQFKDDIVSLKLPKFLNWNQRNVLPKESDISYIKLAFGFQDKFIGDILRPISGGGTVTFAALQVAFHMGFSEVVLIGLDHRFDTKGTPNLIERRVDLNDANHFHPDYFPKGVRWQLPDLHRSELAYAKAREAFESVGRRILDATLNGACTVFEKVDYPTLF